MRPPEEVIRELSREWPVKADMDLSAAWALLGTGEHSATVAFDAQQAAEKALKGFLVWRQVEFPKTHDIKRLLVLCGSVDADLAGSLAAAAELTPYGVDYRYPGDYPPASMETAESALMIADRVVASVVERLLAEQPRR